MRVIIAGSRGLTDQHLVEAAVEAARRQGIEITVVLSGKAPVADTLGERCAQEHAIHVEPYPAKWNDVAAPGSVVRSGRHGPYNVLAGFERNQEMAEKADALIALWDGKSRGTRDVIERMRRLGKPVYVHLVGASC